MDAPTGLTLKRLRPGNVLALFALLTANLLPHPTPHTSHLSPPAGIQVLADGADGLTLALDTPTFEIERAEYGGRTYDRLAVPGLHAWGEPGSPSLPAISGLIGAPPGAQVSLKITSGTGALLEGRYTLPPAPRPAPAQGDLQPGRLSYEPNAETYRADEWLPASPVVLGEEAWIRDQRVIRVTFFPFQYNPARQSLRWHESLQAEVTFIGGQKAAAPSASPFEGALAATLLNYETAQGWRLPSNSLPLRAPAAYASLGDRFDLVVVQDGVYRLTYADLKAAGMDVDNLNPQNFHLYNQGQDVAIYVSGEDDGSFDPGDTLTFFGEKFRGDLLAERYQDEMTRTDGLPANNWFWKCEIGACDLAGAFEQYTDENVYSLTTSGPPGPRMPTVSGAPTGGAVPTVYTTTVRAEQSNLWWSYEFQSEDVWFWSRIQKAFSELPYSETYSTMLTAVAPSDWATIHAEVVSRSATSGYRTEFFINSQTTPFADITWDGAMRRVVTGTISQALLVEGSNTLKLTLSPENSSSGIVDLFFDFFEITYFRNFVAENDRLGFTRYQPGLWQYQASGFTSPAVEVYNLTDPFNPVRVLNPQVEGSGPYTVKFTANDGAKARYFITGANSLLKPKSITAYQPPDFANMPAADYLFITHADFIPSLQPLAAYHAANGLNVAIVDVDDLYREFNDGIFHPIAIKNFIAFTFATWANPPAYVALVGSGHWNFKNYGSFGSPPIYMPPNLAYIDPWQGQTDSANLLATIVGDDVMPDLHISRIPVSSPAEMDAVVEKTLAYLEQPDAGWQYNVLFIADNVPDPKGAGDFVALSDGIISEYIESHPYLQPLRIYENDLGCTSGAECPAATDAIINTLNTSGALLLNYTGHASLDVWSGERIWVNEDVALLDNASQLPVILSMTCLDGYWLYPNVDSLAKTFLVSEGKGAVATFSPTGLGVATGHDELQRGFYDSLVNGQAGLAEAVLAAKLRLFTANYSFDLVHTFTLFGDPALQIALPESFYLSPASSANWGQPGSEISYTFQLTNKAKTNASFTLAITGNTWNASVTPQNTGSLAPNSAAPIAVTVTVPSNADDFDFNEFSLVATSQTNPSDAVSSNIIATAISHRLFLPVLTR